MPMEPHHWITIGLFFFGQIISMIGVVISTRMDVGRVSLGLDVVKRELTEMQQEIKQLGVILVTLADYKGELNRLSDRQLAQGQRLDEFIKTSSADRIELRNEINNLKVTVVRKT